MAARDVVARTLRTVLRAVEGSYRAGPYQLPITGGWLPEGAPENWWQLGLNPVGGDASRSSMVEACVSAYAQTAAMCPGDHWRKTKKGGRERVSNSAASRMLKRPNRYQSISDFLLNVVRSLYLEGNAYALALRNDRFEVDELHLMNPHMSRPQVATGGDIFYRLGGNEVITNQLEGQQQIIVPQRDVLHVRMHCDRRWPVPLVGETPLSASIADIGVNDAIIRQQMQFYNNQARPSAVLSTDLVLDKDQVQFIRDRWDEQSKGLNQGKTPLLTAGLKVIPWGAPSRDAQIAEVFKLSQERIALAFRVPLEVLGIGGHTFSSTEALMQFWVATGLGFCLNHVEEALGLLFQLKGQPDEYIELDTSPLLRSQMKDRLEALARGVQGGIYSPNEARHLEGYDAVEAGSEPRVQQQVVPLSAASAIQPSSPSGPHPPPAPGPSAPPSAPAAAKPEPEKPPPPKDHRHAIERETRRLFENAERINSDG